MVRRRKSLLAAIDRKKSELDTRRPLTLRETDMVLRGLTIDRKPLKEHMEAVGHKEAFDEYHVKHDLGAMQKLFAGYVNARLDSYLMILGKLPGIAHTEQCCTKRIRTS